MSQSPRYSEGGTTLGRNLENFLEGRVSSARPLTSPRSLEVCNTHGVRPEELVPRSKESFNSGGVPRALVERRWEHQEEKRKNILNFLRGKRQELIDNPPEETPSRMMTPRNGSSPRSNSRCSSQRNRDLQQRNYEERMAEREDKFRAIENAVTINTAKAELNRLDRNDRIRGKGEQRWREVHEHKQQAKELEDAKHDEQLDKHFTNELKRETSKTAAQTARGWKAADLAAENSKSVQSAQERARELEEQRYRDANEKWQTIEEKSANALSTKEEYKGQWQDRGFQNAQQQAETKDRAGQLLDERTTQKHSKLSSKNQRYEEHTMTLEEQREAERDARARGTERYYETVGRGHAVTQAKTELRKKKSNLKEEKFLNNQDEVQFEQLLERENKREKTQDHVEIVTRMRRAREYQRDKYMRSKYLNQQ